MSRGFHCRHHLVAKTLFNIGDLSEAEESGLVNHFVFNVGNNLELPTVHQKDDSNHAVHNLAFDAFQEATNETMKHAREEMECTTLGHVLERLKLQFKLA